MSSMENENIVHIYVNCEYVNEIFKELCVENDIQRVNNLDDIIFLKQGNKLIRRKISIFKLIIWKMRLKALNKQNFDKKIIYSYYKRYTNSKLIEEDEENR